MRLPASSPSYARSGVNPWTPNGDPSGARNRPVVRNRRWAWSKRTTCCTVRLPAVGVPSSSARRCHRSMPAKSSPLLAWRGGPGRVQQGSPLAALVERQGRARRQKQLGEAERLLEAAAGVVTQVDGKCAEGRGEAVERLPHVLERP